MHIVMHLQGQKMKFREIIILEKWVSFLLRSVKPAVGLLSGNFAALTFINGSYFVLFDIKRVQNSY
jgi:hypothetical protein